MKRNKKGGDVSLEAGAADLAVVENVKGSKQDKAEVRSL